MREFLRWGAVAIGGALFFAVAVLADTSGVLLPSSEGSYLQWTPSTGTTHYTLVDESSCNGNTDYNRTTAVGNRDSYGVSLASVPNGAEITKIDIAPCASKHQSGGSASTLNIFYRWNGVNSADAGSYSLNGTTPVNLATTSFASLSLIKGSGSALQIGAVFSAGNKGARLSRIAATVTYTPLAAPTNLSASATTTSQIYLTWSDNTAIEDGYRVDRSPNGVSGWTGIATTSVNATSFNNTGLVAGTTYYYRAQAFNSGGSSGYSNTASATTIVNPPAAPTNLTATASTTSAAIRLTWIDNATDETAFSVERGTDGISFSHIATTSANAVIYDNTGLVLGTTYYYRVRAHNAGGYSGYTNTASATTGTIPNAPSSLALSKKAGTSTTDVILDWVDNAANEDGFKVERSTNGTDFSQIGTRGADVTTYTDAGLIFGTFWYRIRAYNGLGNSGYSNTASTTVP